jgi:hypothetical protein
MSWFQPFSRHLVPSFLPDSKMPFRLKPGHVGRWLASTVRYTSFQESWPEWPKTVYLTKSCQIHCSSPSASWVIIFSFPQVDTRSALLVVAHGRDRKSSFILLVCVLSDFSFSVCSIQLSCHHCQDTVSFYSQVNLSHWKLACSCNSLWKKQKHFPFSPKLNIWTGSCYVSTSGSLYLMSMPDCRVP